MPRGVWGLPGPRTETRVPCIGSLHKWTTREVLLTTPEQLLCPSARFKWEKAGEGAQKGSRGPLLKTASWEATLILTSSLRNGMTAKILIRDLRVSESDASVPWARKRQNPVLHG